MWMKPFFKIYQKVNTNPACSEKPIKKTVLQQKPQDSREA